MIFICTDLTNYSLALSEVNKILPIVNIIFQNIGKKLFGRVSFFKKAFDRINLILYD